MRPVFGLLTSSVLLVGLCYAQTTTSVYDGVTPAGLAPGSPASSYPLLGFEHYSPFSGGLNPSVQLYHVGGRGNAGLDLLLNLQQVWRAKKERASTSSSPIIVVQQYPQGSGSPTADDLAIAGAVYSRTGTQAATCSDGTFAPASSVTRVIFRMPNGTEIELVDKNTNASIYTIANPCNRSSTTYDAGRGTLFTSTDGSAINFVADSKVLDTINYTFGEADGKLNGALIFPNGVTYRIDNSTVTYIRDANGNKTTFSYGSDLIDVTWYLGLPAATQITDSTGRVITINYHDSSCTHCASINYAGIGGVSRKVLVTFANLSGGLLRDGGSVQTLAQLFPSSQALGGSNTFDPILPSTISYPDGFVYSFHYNVYGEVTEVNVAQGGAVEYEYGDGHNNAAGSGFEGSATDSNPVIVYRRLLERREYANGAGAAWTSKTDYTISYGSQTVDTDVTYNPSGSAATQVVHRMIGSPLDALSLSGTSCNQWNEGFEAETDYGIAPATRVVQNTQKTQSGCVNNPQITSVTTKNDANQVSQVTYQYDAYNNVLQQTETALGSGSPGPALRTTVNQYLWQNTASYAAPTVNLVRAPYSSFVYPGSNTSGTVLSGKVWNYDASGRITDEPNSASIPNHDSGYLAAGSTTRGNVTSLYEFLNTIPTGSNQYIGYQMSYDSLGNVLAVYDPNAHTSSFSYADSYSDGVNRFSYAYPTSTTNALNQTTTRSYDYSLGALVSSTDPNRILTTYSYWSANNSSQANGYAADRSAVTIQDANGLKAQTKTTYPNPNVVATQHDQTTSGDGGMVAYDVRDGLGRSQESDQFINGSSLVAICTKRDAMGNPSFVTNPFSASVSPACPNTSSGPNTGSNPGTTYVRDALSRVLSATLADGSTATTSYSGAAVTSVDPAGHKKVTNSDVDGNLISVSEDPSTLKYLTLYGYDPLDNLTLVCQGGSTAAIVSGACQNAQSRAFTYDSLSRRLTASNPESGAFTYTWDNNGNLTKRVESARSITTTYGFDALNRLTGVTYGDGVTPNVTYTWDTASSNGVGN